MHNNAWTFFFWNLSSKPLLLYSTLIAGEKSFYKKLELCDSAHKRQIKKLSEKSWCTWEESGKSVSKSARLT